MLFGVSRRLATVTTRSSWGSFHRNIRDEDTWWPWASVCPTCGPSASSRAIDTRIDLAAFRGRFADLSSWPPPAATTSTATGRYGTATASAWNQLNPRLIHQGVWAEHPGALPIVEGTVIPLTVGHLPGTGTRPRYGCGTRTPP